MANCFCFEKIFHLRLAGCCMQPALPRNFDARIAESHAWFYAGRSISANIGNLTINVGKTSTSYLATAQRAIRSFTTCATFGSAAETVAITCSSEVSRMAESG